MPATATGTALQLRRKRRAGRQLPNWHRPGSRVRPRPGLREARRRSGALALPGVRRAGAALLAGPAAAALTLPRVGSEIPRALGQVENLPWLGTLAAALLRHGILEERDWNGALATSVAGGLSRWVNQELRADDMHFIRLSLEYTDNTYASYDDPDEGGLGFVPINWLQKWGVRGANVQEDHVGAFLLRVEESELMQGMTPQVVLRTAIERLEALELGAGWSVYGLLEDALGAVLGTSAMTPGWGQQLLDYNGGYMQLVDDTQEDDDPDVHHSMSMDRFTSEFPAEIFKAQWDPKPVRRALRKIRRAPLQHDSALKAILEETLALNELADRRKELLNKRPLNEWDYFDSAGWGSRCEMSPAVVLRWSESDSMERVVDDYHEMAMETVGMTDVVFLRGFQIERPETLDTCLAGLKLALEILVRTDRLLQRLHCPERLVSLLERVRV